MSELLTTGQVIDRLKVGEVAKCVNSHAYQGRKISKNKHGIYFEGDDLFAISYKSISAKWRILPNYVSFAEAMKAIEEGKDVHCQYNDKAITIKSYDNRVGSICFDRHCESGGAAAIKIAWIVAGKWTIEED